MIGTSQGRGGIHRGLRSNGRRAGWEVWSGSARRVLALGAVAVAMAGCAVTGGYRDTDVPITATTRFTPAGFEGAWHVIARFPNAVLPACPDQVWRFATTPAPARFKVGCGASGAPALVADLAIDPRGVMRVKTADLDTSARAFWVIWMDEDLRTAVIGTRGGEMGWVLNRTADIPADRLNAAKALLEFNGYDNSGLEVLKQ